MRFEKVEEGSRKASSDTGYKSAKSKPAESSINGLDPEVGRNSGSESNNLYMGVDHGNYPQARNFTFGLNLTF